MVDDNGCSCPHRRPARVIIVIDVLDLVFVIPLLVIVVIPFVVPLVVLVVAFIFTPCCS